MTTRSTNALLSADEAVQSRFLEFVFADQIAEHEQGTCACDLREGGFGLCYIGQWREGCVDTAAVIDDMTEADEAQYFTAFVASID